ncbi:MAG: hypothetical protein HYV63_21885 [Candidatus Schekmanbacteria bacterium]|nr:hypothetical protein [Candidatus Schekmanbacteria bacterium]
MPQPGTERKGFFLVFLLAALFAIAVVFVLFSLRPQQAIVSEEQPLGATPASPIFTVDPGDRGEPTGQADGAKSSASSAEKEAEAAGVQRVVAERNAASAAQLRKFREEGWDVVTAEEPNPQVGALEPGALAEHEEEVQLQLQTNTFSGATLDRVSEIVRRAPSQKTRYVALENLGRSRDFRAQELLVELYRELPSGESREQILQYFKPRDVDDAVATLLFEQLADPGSSEQTKRQATFPLAVMAIVGPGGEREEPPTELMARVPATWRGEFRKIHSLLVSGGQGHRDE